MSLETLPKTDVLYYRVDTKTARFGCCLENFLSFVAVCMRRISKPSGLDNACEGSFALYCTDWVHL